MKAAYITQSGLSEIERVYDAPTRGVLEGKFDFCPTVATRASVMNGDYVDVECLFSTWGCPPMTEEELAACLPNLKAVFYAAGSVQAFARPLLARGVTVVSAATANGIPVAEYTVAQIILAHKGFYGASRLCSHSNEDRRSAHNYFSAFPGNYGAAVGLVGLGVIGAEVARRLKDYRLSVYAYDPYCSTEKAEALGVTLVDLHTLFERCLTVSNHTPNIPETRGMLTYEYFSRMPAYGTFLNTGRGAQVVEDDLVRALREVPTRTAVLDVTDPEPSPAGHPFYEMSNVILTPHIAGSTGDECFRMGQYMLEEADRYLRGEPLRCAVTLKMLETMA